MLEKKHLVFLAGATAPFAPPLCTALVLIFKQLTYGHVSKASEIKLNDEILSRTYLACQGTFTVIAIFDLGAKLCLINFKKLLPCTGENSLKLKRNTWWMTT